MPERALAIQKNSQLQDDIRNTTVTFGEAALWWLGQATYAIKLGETLLYVRSVFPRRLHEDPPTLQETPLCGRRNSPARR